METSRPPQTVAPPIYPPRQCEVRVPARLASLQIITAVVRTFCAAVVPPPPDRREMINNIELAIHEAAMNVVRHGFGGGADDYIVLRIIFGGDTFVFTLTDPAPAFTLPSLTQPDPLEPREGGYGVFLIRQLMDEVEYSRANTTNTLRMVKRISLQPFPSAAHRTSFGEAGTGGEG